MTTAFETTAIGGLDIACLSIAGLVDLMAADCKTQQAAPRLVFDANGQALSMNQSDESYRDAMKAADLIHADGQFLVWVSRLRRKEAVPERSATTDLIWAAAERAQSEGLSFFLLGGPDQLAEQAAERLRQRFPGLRIVGTHNGYFQREDEEAIVERINASGANVVWVGLGKPHEQQFAARNKHRFTANWVITCGGCFNFVTGGYRRAPGWMQRAGVEWLHRMFTGPRSLRHRYLTTTPHALFLALTK